ncbi:MAG: hypothetical protein HYW00_01275 [Candidatus Colwellbacteria bacterium]|nr:hypothetical protein [Candidatus Colwellbacteria bacterium]
MAAYDEVRQILERARGEDEALTTLGAVELPTGECDDSPLVKVVVRGENGEPVVMTGSLISTNEDPIYGGALLHVGGGFSEFSLDCPALLISIPSEVEGA